MKKILMTNKLTLCAPILVRFQCRNRLLVAGLLTSLIGGLAGCEKIVEVPLPATSIPQSMVFTTDQEAISALAGTYYRMVNSNTPTLINGGMTIYSALASDELVVFDKSNTAYLQYYQNNLQANNPFIAYLWENSYQLIYQFNAILEGVHSNHTLTPAIQEQIAAQAMVGRAFIYYQLTTLFGAVPYITITDWRTTTIRKREPVERVYSQLIADLKEAEQRLPASYNLITGGKTSFNKWAATALLARLHAITGNWQGVLTACDKIMNSGDYALAATPAGVFHLNSPEAILQLKQDNTTYSFNATREGMFLLPIDGLFPFPPFAYLPQKLLLDFESGDQRFTDWTQSREIDSRLLHYPAKYKVGPSQAEPGGQIQEGYMVLRLAEIVLLRAEARFRLDDISGAIDDLNLIRQRATLKPLPTDLQEAETLRAVQQERRIELFCEWGHRWVDLNRWGVAETILSINKSAPVSRNALLFPIPANELMSNPNLDQNTGY
ncbi:RagB/SusD family nutrient uptake outer membrane protein [Paraflavitalea pollutisoli]|uniref:RagB/SusD family nutrient uptake outer membrane protein n=1 Tax=Paraflavitalea pollutisoli TaxID=3034143 RepID=UPI0023EB1E75|nr:RagB/SusD family nutrient uptake outer membrane protein [Paraflavitalea sp. H1-2-19X]